MWKFIFILPLVFFAQAITAQENNPVSWHFSAQKLDSRTFEVRLSARVRPPWHIYAQDIPEGTALPTAIEFDKNPLLKVEGGCKEVGTPQYITLDGLKLKYYSETVEFVQVIKLKSPVKTIASGNIVFMACTEERCLPPAEKQFTISLDGRN